MNEQHNPPAFPSDKGCDSWQCRKPSLGMELRDYFAAKAMAGWLASYSREGDIHPVNNDCQQSVAELSYALADAMLAARKETK